MLLICLNTFSHAQSGFFSIWSFLVRMAVSAFWQVFYEWLSKSVSCNQFQISYKPASHSNYLFQLFFLNFLKCGLLISVPLFPVVSVFFLFAQQNFINSHPKFLLFVVAKYSTPVRNKQGRKQCLPNISKDANMWGRHRKKAHSPLPSVWLSVLSFCCIDASQSTNYPSPPSFSTQCLSNIIDYCDLSASWSSSIV